MSWFASFNRERIIAGIQVSVSAGLSVYTYGKPTYGVFPWVCSAIAVGGTYNFFKAVRKNNQRSSWLDMERVWSSWDVASGLLTYSTGLYAFSEALRRDDKMWIPCLAIAATGHYFTSLTVNTWNRFLYLNPYLRCLQLMFEPALIASAATYLFYFRKHNEVWLQCLSFLVTAATGLKNILVGTLRETGRNDTGLLIQAIEMSMGGCLFSISCALLTFHGVANQFYWPWTSCSSFLTIYGALITFYSLRNFQVYFEMEDEVFEHICFMIAGPILFLISCISFVCISDPVYPIMIPAFCIMTGISICFYLIPGRKLIYLVPPSVLEKYVQRILGPTVAVYSCLVAAYFGYRKGWKIPLMILPFIFFGIYSTVDAFIGED